MNIQNQVKLKHIILLFGVQIILTSCELVGVEVETIKGKWISDITNGQQIILSISDNDKYSSETILNDTTILVKRQGTWVLKNDTLNLYHQSFKNKGISKLYIEQISMNTLTLRNISHGDVIVLHRVYSKNLDYNGRFEEVFNLKRGFWWYSWNIIKITLVIIVAIYSIIYFGTFLNNIIKWTHKKISKNK